MGERERRAEAERAAAAGNNRKRKGRDDVRGERGDDLYSVNASSSSGGSGGAGGAGAATPLMLSEYATQHLLKARQFLCLTGSIHGGVHRMVLRRPVDQLVSVLRLQMGTAGGSGEEYVEEKRGGEEGGLVCHVWSVECGACGVWSVVFVVCCESCVRWCIC